MASVTKVYNASLAEEREYQDFSTEVFRTCVNGANIHKIKREFMEVIQNHPTLSETADLAQMSEAQRANEMW